MRPLIVPAALAAASFAMTSRAAEPKPPPTVPQAITARCIYETLWHQDECMEVAGDTPAAREACAAQQQAGMVVCKDERKLAGLKSTRASKAWGTTKADAIEVCMPQGERAFLMDLRCADGRTPEYRRTGNVGARNPSDPSTTLAALTPWREPGKRGAVDAHVVDVYAVTCGTDTRELYFDMYHCGYPRPWTAPAGWQRPPRLRAD